MPFVLIVGSSLQLLPSPEIPAVGPTKQDLFD